jgi:hypothetical protein
VAERVALAAAQRQPLHLAPAGRFAFIQAASDRMRGEADSLISAVGPILRLATVETASVALDVSGVADPDDRPHILAAHAAGVPYLLTLDQRHLPRGTIVGGVQCWHPDTFLTLFYQQNPDAYRRTRQRITKLPSALPIRLQPRM